MRRGMSELDQLDAPDIRGRVNHPTRFSDMPRSRPEARAAGESRPSSVGGHRRRTRDLCRGWPLRPGRLS